MPKGSRPAARRGAKKADSRTDALRDRVLRGAASAFGRLGYVATRVEDVVADAGVSRPTFYKFWTSKDDVLRALSDLHHRAIRDRLAQAMDSSDDPLIQLERSIEGFLRWRAELGPVGRVLDLEARAPRARLSGHRKQMLEYVIAQLQRGLAATDGEPADPMLLRALIAAAEHVADELAAEPKTTERALQKAKAIVLRIYLGALAPQGLPTSTRRDTVFSEAPSRGSNSSGRATSL